VPVGHGWITDLVPVGGGSKTGPKWGCNDKRMLADGLAEPSESDPAGILVRLKLRNPLLVIHAPHVTIDGTTYDLGWGDHFFALASGRHEVRVFVTQFIFSRLKWGEKNTLVTVLPGQTTMVLYRSPFISFGKAKVSFAYLTNP
jgi:hypothetical protein